MRETLITFHGSPSYKECRVRKTNEHRTIAELLDASDKCVSIEICPNRSLDQGLLPRLGAAFCSVTWHAPSAANLKHVEEIPAMQLASRLSRQGYAVLLHLAGRNLRRQQALEILNAARRSGIRNVFALQGDSSHITEEDDSKCDFPYAADLVKFIRLHFGSNFCIGVAGYPDKHPYSRDLKEDICYLKEKVSNGADFIITQASYDFESFTNFFKRCRKSDIRIPTIPGIFIISSYKTLIGMSKFCGVPISSEVLSIVSKNKENIEAVREFGIYHATELMKNILSDKEHLFNGVHIFSLNDLNLVKEVVNRLGLFKLRLEYPL